MNLADAILLPIVLIGLSVMVFLDLRYTFRKRASENWPSMEATIESATVGGRGPMLALPRLIYRVYFRYSYCVNGIAYVGCFFLLAGDKKSGEALQQALTGKKVVAKYDSRHPEVSFLSDQQFMGKRIMQGPGWTYR
jgi:hypothetical protein